jgi:hypothetical protein
VTAEEDVMVVDSGTFPSFRLIFTFSNQSSSAEAHVTTDLPSADFGPSVDGKFLPFFCKAARFFFSYRVLQRSCLSRTAGHQGSWTHDWYFCCTWFVVFLYQQHTFSYRTNEGTAVQHHRRGPTSPVDESGVRRKFLLV